MHHDKSVTLVVDNLVVLTALQYFHLLVLEHVADMLLHLSPQVVTIVEYLASGCCFHCAGLLSGVRNARRTSFRTGSFSYANFSKFLSVPAATAAAHFSVWG